MLCARPSQGGGRCAQDPQAASRPLSPGPTANRLPRSALGSPEGPHAAPHTPPHVWDGAQAWPRHLPTGGQPETAPHLGVSPNPA